jgi:hypothetical protein
MSRKIHILLLTALLSLVLGGCAGGAFGGFPSETLDVDSTTIVREMQYYGRGAEFGTPYEITLTVPESWVGNFITVQTPTTLTFTFVDDLGRRSEIFSIYALSLDQFWQQNGSYPGVFTSIGNSTDGTYFAYHANPFAFYSGLDESRYQAFTAEVPGIVATLEWMPLDADGVRMY